MRVLIVEDDPHFRCALEAKLVKFGYEVAAAVDGDAAPAMLGGVVAPPLAILD